MDEQELEITYPTRWEYRIIGRDEASLRAAVEAAVEGLEYALQFSRKSGKGSYLAFSLELEVRDEDHRKRVWELLAAHEGIVHLM